jgi:hypothetical protein
VNAGFLSDLRRLLPLADLWIHGHVHDSFDYCTEGVRVVANPRGYPLNLGSARVESELEWENERYDPCYIVVRPNFGVRIPTSSTSEAGSNAVRSWQCRCHRPRTSIDSIRAYCSS